jgi:sulfur-carrier protein
MIKLLYFAGLRETIGVAGEETSVPAQVTTVAALVDWLRMRGDPWASELSNKKRWRVAVNQEVAELTSSIKAGDEVAFFPPVTGG